MRSLDARLAGGANPAEPFINRIARTKILPPWLRLLPYPLPRHELLAGESVLVLEVDGSTSPAGVNVPWAIWTSADLGSA